MYNTGNAGFLTAACSINREIDTKANINFPSGVAKVTTEDIVSYKVTYASTGGKAFIPGSFVASQFELSLNAHSDGTKIVNMYKASNISNIELDAGIKVGTEMVYVPMGVFYPDKDGVTVGDDGYVTVNATDTPPKLKNQFDSSTLSLPCTIEKALNTISTQLGITITLKSSFPNTAVVLEKTFTLTATYREVLMYIAETLGAYVCMGRTGEILFKRCFSGAVNLGCTLDENYLFSVNKHENRVKPFQYINIKANKDDLGVTQSVSGVTTGNSYDIIDNPLTYGHPEDFLPGLVAPVAFNEFFPAIISFQGRPDLDTGDVLSYKYKGASSVASTYSLPVCKHIFEYNGGFKTTVESIGTEEKQVSSADSGVKTHITALKQNLNVLIRDLEQTKSQISDINGDISNLSTVIQTAESLQAAITKIEGDVTKLSELTQTADGLRLAIQSVKTSLDETKDTVNNNQNTLLTYFDFQADALTIGVNSSNIKLKLSNDRIYFLRDDSEVAYFSEGQLYVKDAHFINSLILGNFEFVPRKNGNLSLRRRG